LLLGLSLGLLAAAHAPVTGGEAAEYASEGGLPQLAFETWPGQVFWLAISFGILYLMLSRSVLPRIGGVIEDRRDKIADDLDEANRLQRQAEEAQERHEKALADARAKAHAIAAETRERMTEEQAQRAEAAEAEFAKKTGEAEERILAATNAALGNVKTVAGDAASALVEKLTGSAPSETAVASAVDAANQG
jgi:F-type H+-transporting ATPase subunit b